MFSIPVQAQPDSLWARDLGGTYGYSLIQTLDGGYSMGGYIEENLDNYRDFHIIKTDSNGEIQWRGTYGGVQMDVSFALCQARNGSYLLSGYTTQGAYLVCTDSIGEMNWDRFIDRDSGVRKIYSSTLAFDGDFIIWGMGTNEHPRQGVLLKIDNAGEEIWRRHYGGEGSNDGMSVINTTDGGYLLVGQTSSIGAGSLDMWAVKVDSAGEIEWERAYGTELTEYCFGAVQTDDGGYVLAGSIEWAGMHHEDALLVRIDSEGEELWTRRFGGDYDDTFYSIDKSFDGGFVMGGVTCSFRDAPEDNFYFVRTDSLGEIVWETVYGGRNQDWCHSIISTTDGGYALGGCSLSFGRNSFWMVKTGPDPLLNNVELLDPAFPSDLILHTPYPNPFNSTTRIAFQLPYPSHVNLSIRDQQGRQVTVLLNQNLTPGSHEVRWEAENQPSGMYFCMMDADGFKISKGVVFVR